MAMDEMIKLSTAIWLVVSHLVVFVLGMFIFWIVEKIKN